MGRNTLVFADTCDFIGSTPRSEATGGNPAGVDVRRAGMTNKGDATLSLNGALHTSYGIQEASRCLVYYFSLAQCQLPPLPF
ncbi:MAG: hypothetical protein ACREOO_16450 [bacterium]